MNAPATTTRAAFGATATAPRSPRFRLAGRDVTQEMFYAAQNAKRAGRKTWLVMADDPAGDDLRGAIPGVGDGDCPNCNGYGQFVLDIAAAGPFRDHPGTTISDPEKGVVPLSATYHGKAWWKVVRQIYPCPVCAKTKEIVL